MTPFDETPPHVTRTRAAASPAPGRHMTRDLGRDANGCPLEEWEIDGYLVTVHVDDIPDSDVTTVHGLRVTTPVRTVIDLAASLLPTELDALLADVLTRRLVTVDEIAARLAEPDMASRPGASVLRTHPALRRQIPDDLAG